MYVSEWEEKRYRTNWWYRAANCHDSCLVFTVISLPQGVTVDVKIAFDRHENVLHSNFNTLLMFFFSYYHFEAFRVILTHRLTIPWVE